ncbi:MAG: glycosyl transferase [Nitrospira sp. SCN 59-13]|nr:MAG: glycosyl transferase [Nitrospira sp. SCN 59-13]
MDLIPLEDLRRRERWRSARRVLAVRLDALGDVIMTGPALRALKQAHPDRHLTLLTSSGGTEAARLMPFVDEIISYGAPWMKASRRQSSATDQEMIRELSARQFDAAVILTVYSQNPLPAAMLCHLADIPLRLAHCRENPYQLLTDWVPEREPEQGFRHEVRRQLDLVATIGARSTDDRLTLTVPEQTLDDAMLLLDRLSGGKPERVVVLHPGATALSRRYPPDQFAVVARRLALDLDRVVLFTGVEEERPLVEAVRRAMCAPSHALAGCLDLPQLAGLISQVPLVISNNTGTIHIAGAVGTPVVDLYALTNPQHTPWMVPHRVLFHDVPCKYCYRSICPSGHHECLTLVTPDEVVGAAVDLLEHHPLTHHAEGAAHLVHAWN